MDMASSSCTATQNQTQRENAFDELAPHYSAPKSTEPWDIFINHCGRDVKHTLATTIYHKLHSMGFHVFLDKEELEAGDSFPAELQHAIATATLHIAIFSPNYAHSPWCLTELSLMLKSGAKIIPVFYHVEPSDLRWTDKGKYADAFAEHEKKGRYTNEKLDEWKKTLCNSSFLHGYKVNKNEDEATVLKDIVNCSLKIMEKVPLWVAEHPLGMDELVQGFKSVATDHKVKITGIVGMGGSGKTTLAKELYNRNFPSFERHSFVFDVRDAASRNAMCEKQKKLLADLGVDRLSLDHVDKGKVVLANRLSAHRALIVLDDVDHIDQLNALLPNKDNLGSHSMVIVTTRELGVLKSWGLSCIYNMPGLDKPHAKQLFCWHAFLQPSAPAEFETLVQDFLRACNGLPLSLKVLGAQLYGRMSKDYWESQLNKIIRILPGEIKQRLQISYEALDEEEREMFLDVACFFIGNEESGAIAVWDGSGWSGLHGLETLVNKCLVELVEEKLFDEVTSRIRMHDHLRDMGREIASRRLPYRLWCREEVDKMKKHSTKRKPIRGIQPEDAFVAFKEYTHQLMRNSSRQFERLGFSNELQILCVGGNEFTEEFASLSENLVWLEWGDFLLRNLPSWLTLENLRVLKLYGAVELEELWQDSANPPLHLRELLLVHSPKLQRLPSSIRRLQHLEKLVLEFHGSSLSEEFCGLQSLECLQLDAPVLSSLPAGFGNLTSLRNINMKRCKELSSLPAGFGNLTSLRKINMEGCRKLSMLPDSFSHLIHLEVLNLLGCEMLSSLPADFGNLTSLRNINLKFCKHLNTLPDSFKQLIHLEVLNLSYCAKLKLRLDILENIRKLKVLYLSNCEELEDLPHEIMNQVLLTELHLEGCIKLRGLPTSNGELGKLDSLKIEFLTWKSLETSLVKFPSLKSIEILKTPGKAIGYYKEKAETEDCKQFSRISITNDQFPSLETLESLNSSFVEIETLPVSLKILKLRCCNFLKNIGCISGLIKLERLVLDCCRQLEELPSFADLASLKRFNMLDCPKVEKIEGLEHAKSFKELYLLHCPQLIELPSFAVLASLNKFVVRNCPKIEKISGLKQIIEEIESRVANRRYTEFGESGAIGGSRAQM